MSTNPLSSSEIRALRAKLHPLKPVVMVGAKGLTEAVIKETNVALEAHELIKVKIMADRDTRREICRALIEQTGAELVQEIGQIAAIYRKRQES